MGTDENGEADQHHPEQDAERDLGSLRGADPWLPERRHAVGDGLDTGDGGASGGKGSKEENEGDSRRRMDRDRGADLGHRVGMKRPDDEDGEDADDEHQRRQHQEPRRLRDADEIDRGEQHEADETDHEQVGCQSREHAGETRCPGREADRDGEDVIDDERRRSEQRDAAAEVELGDRVRPSALGMGRDHLRVGEDEQDEHPRDDQRQRHREPQRAGPGENEDEHHRLRPVGDARQCIETERGETAADGQFMALVSVLAGAPGRAMPSAQGS